MIKSNPKPGLIEFRYGTETTALPAKQSMRQRIGLWDNRRVFLCLVVMTLIFGLGATMYGTRPTTVTVSPSGTIIQTAQVLSEAYDLDIFNGKPFGETYLIRETGIGQLESANSRLAVTVARSSEHTAHLIIDAPRAHLNFGGRYPVKFLITDVGKAPEQHIASTFFYVPEH